MDVPLLPDLSSMSIEDKIYRQMRDFIRMVALGHSNAVLLLSDGGLGKSYQILKVLQECGLIEGEDYVYLNTYSTPLALYNFLYEHANMLVVLDDMEGLLDDRRALSMLKSILWSASKHRYVHYLSTSPRLFVPMRFEFTGRVIFALNDLPKATRQLKAVLTRCIVCELKLTHQEILQLMYSIAEKPFKQLTREQRLEVVKFIEENTDETTKDFNLRMLVKGMEMRSYSETKWRDLLLSTFETDETLRLLRHLARSGMSVEEQAREFTRLTGMSRATFFRYRQKVR